MATNEQNNTSADSKCPHTTTHVETVEKWPKSPEDVIKEYRVYVCDACDETLDGDPDIDKAEAIAEMAVDCND